jgi:hypothetical protein
MAWWSMVVGFVELLTGMLRLGAQGNCASCLEADSTDTHGREG